MATVLMRADPVVDDAMETSSLLIERFMPDAMMPLRPTLGDAVLDID